MVPFRLGRRGNGGGETLADEGRVQVVPHTHWDREWYSPFEVFRMRLVRLLDRLLDLLDEERAYPAFLLDAQTVVLEDYLEIRPENESRLRGHLANGRIEVGPWYVQPDEFLVSGESLIRNLLTARRVSKRYGDPNAGLRVGYLPDMFGHMSQMPQILQGFGIDNAILWRGISAPEAAPEFIWRAADGSNVLALHLPDRCGYSMVYRLPTDPEAALRQIAKAAEDLNHRGRWRLILLGSDHMEPQRGLPDLIASAAALRDAPAELVLGGLGSYMDRLRTDLTQQGLLPEPANPAGGLPVREGELRKTNHAPGTAFNFLLPNVLSSRMPLKLLNAEVERELTYWAEPMAAVARLAGAPSELAFLQHAWGSLLRNHPHDSIGGCSCDAVHRQMVARFESALQIAKQVVDESAARLATQVDTSGVSGEGRLLMLINTTPRPRNEVVDVSFDIARGEWRDLEVSEPSGAPVSAQVVEAEEAFRTTTMPEPELFPVTATNPASVPAPDSGWFTVFEGVRQVRVRFAAQVPGYGYATYCVRPVSRGRVNRGSLRTGALSAENGVLGLELTSSGDLSLRHLQTGRLWRNCLLLEDGGDAGDGYTYAPPPEDEVLHWHPNTVAVVEDGPVAVTFRLMGNFLLPVGLEADRRCRTPDRVPCPIQIDLTLATGAPLVEARIRYRNSARDHRLRLVIPTGLSPGWSCAEGQWDVILRPTSVRHPSEAVWIEDESTCHPTHGFVDASENTAHPGFAVIGLGLREYELTPRGDLCLTMLRATGWVGAPEPLTIVNGAGPRIRAPQAQLEDTAIDVRVALVPHGPGADLWQLSREWQNPCRAFPQRRHSGTDPLAASWLSVPEGLDVSTFKEADSGDAVILRLFNPGDVTRQGSVRLPSGVSAVAQSGLDEHQVRNMQPTTDGSLPVKVSPKELVTLRCTTGFVVGLGGQTVGRYPHY